MMSHLLRCQKLVMDVLHEQMMAIVKKAEKTARDRGFVSALMLSRGARSWTCLAPSPLLWSRSIRKRQCPLKCPGLVGGRERGGNRFSLASV